MLWFFGEFLQSFMALCYSSGKKFAKNWHLASLCDSETYVKKMAKKYQPAMAFLQYNLKKKGKINHTRLCLSGLWSTASHHGFGMYSFSRPIFHMACHTCQTINPWTWHICINTYIWCRLELLSHIDHTNTSIWSHNG